MNKSIIVSSDRLKKNSLKKKILNDIVNDCLYRLNNLIESTSKNNKTYLISNLPVSFNIPETFNYKDFQIEVYYNIVEILESKGYEINIKIEKDETIIKINWKPYDDININSMKTKLKSIMF